MVCKPHPLCYHLAARLISSFNSSLPAPPRYPYPAASRPLQHFIFFDDSARNVEAALELGMHSVLIRPGAAPEIQCSLSAENLLQLEEKLPELFNNQQLRYRAPVATPSAEWVATGVSEASRQVEPAVPLNAANPVSDPTPATGTAPRTLAMHSTSTAESRAVASHQVQPSEQLADEALADLAVDVSSYELQPHPCDSHYVLSLIHI